MMRAARPPTLPTCAVPLLCVLGACGGTNADSSAKADAS
jgi:hypothetical protein